MDQGLTLDWTPILWVGGIFLLIITGLLGIIAWQIRTDKAQSLARMEKHEGWIMAQQKEIHEVTKYTHTAVELIKVEQASNNERLKVFQEHLKGISFKDKKRGRG